MFLVSPAGPEEEDRPRHPQAGVGVGESEVPGAEGRQGLGDRGRRQDGDRAGGARANMVTNMEDKITDYVCSVIMPFSQMNL